jgi:DnaJ family protein B protein 4
MDYYEVLGVKPNATPDQIKKQYRKLSMEFHPDRPHGNATKFKEINEAYEHLSDETLRKQYDQPQMPDIFEMLFKHDFPQPNFMFQTLMKPPPLTIHISITLDQAYTGGSIPVPIERWININHIKQLERETQYITLPEGIDNNECLMLQNKGNMGPDGTLGDVRIIVNVEPHPSLERNGIDLIHKHSITLKEALCGFSFDLDYLQGKSFKINNAKGHIVSPSYKKTIPNMGMKRDQSVGKLIILFNIVFPTSLSETTLDTLATLL